ncbi:hypothetical protein [Streptomyces sp. NPDC056192]|uniref:hypothetical protein n=1 Tax=Streptomyces sp. NPDC056192 TaxID=3345743 RepID=UPI0035DD7D1E
MAMAVEAPASNTAEGPTSHTQNRAALVPATRTAPAASQALSLTAMSVQDAWGFAKALAESSLLPRQYQNNPGSVLWALEYGRGIGLDVITTIQSVHVIQGKATQSADLMAALTRRAGHRMRMTSTDDRAEVTIYRSDDPDFPFTSTWDTAKATRAKLLNKDTWRQYPAAMLRARAISECVRMACPEVLHGAIYTPEEIGAAVDADGVPLDAPVPQPRPSAPEPVAPPVRPELSARQDSDESAPAPAAFAAAAPPKPQSIPSRDEVLDKLYLQAIGNRSHIDALKQIAGAAKAEKVIDMEVEGPPPTRERMTLGALIDLLLADAQAANAERSAA